MLRPCSLHLQLLVQCGPECALSPSPRQLPVPGQLRRVPGAQPRPAPGRVPVGRHAVHQALRKHLRVSRLGRWYERTNCQEINLLLFQSWDFHSYSCSMYLDVGESELALAGGELLAVALHGVQQAVAGGQVQRLPGEHLQPPQVAPHHLHLAPHCHTIHNSALWVLSVRYGYQEVFIPSAFCSSISLKVEHRGKSWIICLISTAFLVSSVLIFSGSSSVPMLLSKYIFTIYGLKENFWKARSVEVIYWYNLKSNKIILQQL